MGFTSTAQVPFNRALMVLNSGYLGYNKLAEPLPILGGNTTSQPIRRLFLYSPLHLTDYITTISPLLPHYQDQYRNNHLPYPYSLRWYYHPEMGKGSLIDFTRFRF